MALTAPPDYFGFTGLVERRIYTIYHNDGCIDAKVIFATNDSVQFTIQSGGAVRAMFKNGQLVQL